jgi:hypothetical protein
MAIREEPPRLLAHSNSTGQSINTVNAFLLNINVLGAKTPNFRKFNYYFNLFLMLESRKMKSGSVAVDQTAIGMAQGESDKINSKVASKSVGKKRDVK